MIYIQRKQGRDLETVDEFPTRKEARAMLAEYRLSDRSAHFYTSSRPCRAWVEDKPPRIVCAVEPDGCALLVILPDSPRLPEFLDVYARFGQHSTSHRDYIRNKCRDLPPEDPAASALVREWCDLGPDKTDPATVQFFTRAQSGLA